MYTFMSNEHVTAEKTAYFENKDVLLYKNVIHT